MCLENFRLYPLGLHLNHLPNHSSALTAACACVSPRGERVDQEERRSHFRRGQARRYEILKALVIQLGVNPAFAFRIECVVHDGRTLQNLVVC